ncbi:uncharacterized protein LOC119650712 isoform X3 [Hermetia illucens]|uniref:uncharacterized protein LOC119650712 isoform X3 n=1 Tax=Hermetia illucens TaxID=343691 RepID=UPI0018CC32D7|nr:uncharacterized protein LOC119650712 isoform X3 [Hermetia illucens]
MQAIVIVIFSTTVMAAVLRAMLFSWTKWATLDVILEYEWFIMGPSIAIMVIVIAFGVLNRKDSESVLRLAIFSFSFIMLVEVAGSFLVTESYSLLYDNMYLLFQNYISNANKISEFQWRIPIDLRRGFEEMLGVQRKRVDTTDSETQPLGVQTEKP